MTTYYYDDDAERDHFADAAFANDEDAIKWAEVRAKRYLEWPSNKNNKAASCCLYTESNDKNEPFRIVKEWKSNED